MPPLGEMIFADVPEEFDERGKHSFFFENCCMMGPVHRPSSQQGDVHFEEDDAEEDDSSDYTYSYAPILESKPSVFPGSTDVGEEWAAAGDLRG